ncbi:hypothetical protein BD769DRAFT_1520934 [Suillus cothurnatus]|nr:hypothetical protein BD769DRAFT_1520934 [Suillus cothurnatus]
MTTTNGYKGLGIMAWVKFFLCPGAAADETRPQCLVFTCEKHVHRTRHAFMLLLVKVIPLSRCNGYVCKRCEIYVDLILLASSIQVI